MPQLDAEDAEVVLDGVGDQMGAYAKTKADKYLQEKLGITMDKLSDYTTYNENHILSSDQDVYYHVTKNGDPGSITISSIDNITELNNNKLKIEYTYLRDESNFNHELIKYKGIPQTGINNFIIALLVITVIAGTIAIIKYRKNNF